MPLKLGGAGHSLWVELDYVGLEILGVKGNNKAEEKSGREELGFGRHGSLLENGDWSSMEVWERKMKLVRFKSSPSRGSFVEREKEGNEGGDERAGLRSRSAAS
ncbi:hypothetical protein U1Q18_041008 [Sarracenia purpurea var. burkii]